MCRPMPVPVPGPPGPIGPAGPSGGLAAYGSVFQFGEKAFAVTLPGEVVPITFGSNGLLGPGISHTPETADVGTAMAGDYDIRFSLDISVSAAVPATFAIQVNGASLPGGIFTRTLAAGFQTISGAAMVSLAQNDVVRLILTAPYALVVTLTGANVAGSLQIKKLNG